MVGCVQLGSIHCTHKAEYLSGHAGKLSEISVAFQRPDHCHTGLCWHRDCLERSRLVEVSIQEHPPDADKPGILCFYGPVIPDRLRLVEWRRLERSCSPSAESRQESRSGPGLHLLPLDEPTILPVFLFKFRVLLSKLFYSKGGEI